jgi:predicted nuclease of predicted toxin-antitoxin system
LQPEILADENVDFRIIKDLRNKGFNVISILEDYRSISDKEVLQLARDKEALLLTEDKDFGEWVFAHKEKNIGVIFLRYKSDEIREISKSLLSMLFKYGDSLYKKFAVVRVNKVRIRDLP